MTKEKQEEYEHIQNEAEYLQHGRTSITGVARVTDRVAIINRSPAKPVIEQTWSRPEKVSVEQAEQAEQTRFQPLICFRRGGRHYASDR